MYYTYQSSHPNSEGMIVVQNENSTTFIPMNENNTDYKKYLEWVAEGNEAEEWTAQ